MTNKVPEPTLLSEVNATLSGWMVALLAAACGLTVANLYYAQPLINVIAPSLGLAPHNASLIVTLTQLGYCVGLIFLVPLGDLVENRRLVVTTLALLAIVLFVVAGASNPIFLLTAITLMGVSAVAVQMLVPIAAHLAPGACRGRVVGTVMGGLLLGAMMARPVSSLVAHSFGWHAVFACSALVIGLLTLILIMFLPPRHPEKQQNYWRLIQSLWLLSKTEHLLQKRAVYQAVLFATFSLFWTAVPLQLISPVFDFSQREIALFSISAILGALAAPVAGHFADRGWTNQGTALSIGLVAAGFLIAIAGARGSLLALVVACVLIDIGVQANLVLGQREIFSINANQSSRLNGLYMAIVFAGGAIGSFVASPLFFSGGWSLVCCVGFLFPMTALILYFLEPRKEHEDG